MTKVAVAGVDNVVNSDIIITFMKKVILDLLDFLFVSTPKYLQENPKFARMHILLYKIVMNTGDLD